MFRFAALIALGLLGGPLLAQEQPAAKDDQPVSFYRQVRPILQRHCSGCHQPAKKGGQLLLTSYADFQKGGENGAAFTPGKPDESLILDYISGDKPEMPLNAEPLEKSKSISSPVGLRKGPKTTRPRDSRKSSPPRTHRVTLARRSSRRSPIRRTADCSRCRAFKKSCCTKPTAANGWPGWWGGRSGSNRCASRRMVRCLAAVGGTPALFGEAQIWNVADRKLALSMTIAPDTLFGASFNDKGTQLAFGGADNRARVIDVKEGKVIMRFDAHADWVFGTTFSLKNDHLITVSRDMSMKLVIVENAQFVDNITSITPGALKGGLVDVQRHPTKEEVLTGGADGEPKLYKIFRTQARKIGDDFNRIRSYEKLPGRIFDLQFNKDGSRFLVGASTATGGSARIYETDTGKLLHELPEIEGPIFAVAYRPDGKQVAIGGFDGQVRLYDAKTGELVKTFLPVPLIEDKTAAK